jgi:hypothetical protein
MSSEQFANNAQTSLNGAITAAATTLTVASASGFPSSAQFRILVDSELMIVTAGAGTTTWTVARGAEGTTAASHANQATVTQVLTAGGLENLDASYIATGKLALARGGTAADLSGTGGSGQYVKQSSAGAALSVGTIPGSDVPVFGASGSSHAQGAVPDPGSTAGTTRYLREDATWDVPPGGGGVTSPDGGVVQVINGTETGVPAPLNICEGRMTLTSGTPITNSDVTAATTLYFTPSGDGSRIALYDGTRWKYFSFSEISIKLTDSSQTGNTSNGSAVVTNLTNTSQLVRGMQVTGTGIPANTTIASINSATQITLSANATATGTGVALTFKLPNGNNYDVWAVINGSTAALQFGNAWTNSTTRADAISQQDGVWVNTSAINSTDSNAIPAKQGRLLGTIRTTGTAGQTEDSVANRLVANIYSPVARILRATPGYNNNNAQTTFAGPASNYANLNGGTGNQVNFLIPLNGWNVDLTACLSCTSTNNGAARLGIGLDSNTSAVSCAGGSGNIVGVVTMTATYRDVLAAGYHFAAMLGAGGGSAFTVVADDARNGSSADPRATYMEGWVMG